MGLNVKLSTEELRLLLETGYLLAERREWQKAKEVFEGVQALGQAAEVASMGLADLHLVLGNAKDAEKALKAALKASPQFALAHAQLGELCHTQGRKEEAIASLKKAEELDPQGTAGEFARSVLKVMDLGVAYKYAAPKDEKKEAPKKK